MIRFIRVCALVLSVFLAAGLVRAQDTSLPGDVFPDSRSRLPLLKPEAADGQTPRAPAANMAGTQTMSAAMRLYGYRGIIIQADSPLGAGFMQLPILAAAREQDQPYEWSLHELQAVAVSLEPAVIDVVRNRKSLAGVPENEAVVIQMAREIFGAQKLSSATYARALKVFGQNDVVNIVALMADYAATSVTLSAFNQQMPPGWRQFLPLPFTPPDDIQADSRCRLPLIKDRVPGRPAFANPLYGREGAPNGTGPSYIALHAASFATVQASVGRPMIDLAILVTAREKNSQYDWTMNEMGAEKDGLDMAAIETVRDRKPTAGLPEKEASLIELGREVLHAHTVSAATYARALKAFGEQDLLGLVGVMGQHTRETALLTAFDQRLPVGQKPLLPLP